MKKLHDSKGSYLSFIKFDLKMKLTVLLTFASFLSMFANAGYSQSITLDVKNMSVQKVIDKIEVTSKYTFVYNTKFVDLKHKVSIKVKNAPISEVLDQLFEGTNTSYQIMDTEIFLNGRKLVENDLNKQLSIEINQGHQIRGTVKDANGQALPGANIIEKGTTNGTNTDFDGNFSLTISNPNKIIVVSFLGFVTQEIAVNGKTDINLVLQEDNAKLDEVVVVGYGQKAKGAITGAISSAGSEVFENRPVNNSFEALQGQLPGVTITRASGQPGNQGYSLQIRGYSSINGNVPLVLIDGVPGDLNSINPNDIDKVTVLKDASAAIYGARAADGAILVTTKKGKIGKPQITYSANFGYKTPTYLRKVMGTLHFAEFLDEGLRNAGVEGFPDSVFEKIRQNSPPDLEQGWNYGVTNYPGFYGDTNWNDVIYKNSIQQTHNLSIMGGGESNNYLLSLGYIKDDGVVKFGDNHSDKYYLRLNYDFKLLDKLNIQTRTNFENNITKEPTQLGTALTDVPRQFPYAPVYNLKGEFYGYQGYGNPAQWLAEGGQRTKNYSRFTTNFELNYEILKGLKLTGQAAFEFGFYNENAATRTIVRHNYVGEVQNILNSTNSAYYTSQKTLKKIYQGYLNYDKDIDENNKISLTLGTSLEQQKNEGESITGYNFPSNDIFTLNLADKTNAAFADFTGYVDQSALSSYFGRLSYTFKNRLFLDVTARADGSSKFAPSKRYSELFPSIGLAYNLSEEKIINDLNIFDQLKLRGTWGKTGNQDIGSLGLYDYIPLISIKGNYPIGSPNSGLPGASSSTTSADRTWETIINKNIGIDVTMANSKLSLSFDYFIKTNDNMLVNITVPATYGGDPPSSNQGKLVTKGFDAIVNWKDNINDFKYSISLQLSDSKNKLEELKNSDNFGEGLNFARQGYSIYSYFGYVYDGIIKTQEQLDQYKQLENIPSNLGIGDVMYKDLDGDGKLTAFGNKSQGFAGDMVDLGSLLPRYTFSSTMNFDYKNFDLKFFLQGVGNRKVQYEERISTPNEFWWPSLEYYYNKTWSPERPNARYARYIPGGVGLSDIRNYNYHTSTLTVHNVSYLRFKVITLGYTFPKSLCKNLMVDNLRVYFSGQDLITISKGTLGGNFDPEDGYRREGTYPFSKVYSLGLNVNF
ncbi:TonB-dependent receptor [Confluentibacter sediminis]|uniref:TonB-dependent receptor n=1 Tax=Confluentibacter sediminis TaxID=2219045 RepID=UPI000DAC99A6|nr:TonB-dependent receptor [Confluentibacter sediminis]